MQTHTHTHILARAHVNRKVNGLKMATACRRAPSQTTMMMVQELKRTAWLCRLEEGGSYAGKRARSPAMRRLSGSGFFVKSNWNAGIYRKPLAGPFSLKFAALPVAWCSPRGLLPSLSEYDTWCCSLTPLSLIMKQTVRRKHRDITYSWDTCRIISVRGEKLLWTCLRLFGGRDKSWQETKS